MSASVPRSQIIGLVEASEEDLYRLLGTDLLGAQAFPLHPAELTERGARWFAAQRANIAANVCADEGMKRAAVESSDVVAVVTALADLLAAMVLPVAPFTLAALIVKIGLKRLCPEWVVQ